MGTQACPLSQPDTQDTAKQDFEKQSGTDSDSGSSHAPPQLFPHPQDSIPILVLSPL